MAPDTIVTDRKPNDMQISVVVVTFNRARLLAGTLAALALQEFADPVEWEILAVDNNSSDATAETVAEFAKSTSIPVVYVREQQQGVSHARNRGIREARGAVIAFTDDDVVPEKNWVAAIAAAIDRWSADGVGGRIIPRWETRPPQWLTVSRHLLNHLAVMDSDVSRLLPLPLAGTPHVWGANMAFRREVFERVGGFDPRRGIVGKKLQRGEEVDLIRRAMEAGFRIAYDASLTVFHRIGSDRLRKAYFRRLAIDDGEGRARVTPVDPRRSLLGAPRELYRIALAGLWRFPRWMLTENPRAFQSEFDWWASVGRLRGYWRVGLERRAHPKPEGG